MVEEAGSHIDSEGLLKSLQLASGRMVALHPLLYLQILVIFPGFLVISPSQKSSRSCCGALARSSSPVFVDILGRLNEAGLCNQRVAIRRCVVGIFAHNTVHWRRSRSDLLSVAGGK
jgi:hypothetical protein